MSKKKENSTYMKHPPEVAQEIIKMKEAGEKIQTIADTLEVKFNYVRNVCKRFKVVSPEGLRSKNRPRRCKQEDIDKAAELRRTTSLTNQGIADKLGFTKNQVYILLKRSGVKMAPQQLSLIRSHYDPALKQKAIELRKNKVTLEDIAKQLKIGVGTARYICSSINFFKQKIKELGCNSKLDYMHYLAKKNNGQYLESEYRGVFSKDRWFCNKHGEFMSKPTYVSSGHWCSKCGNVSSKAEAEILEFVKSLNVGTVESRAHPYPDSKVEVDIYIPEKKFGIEYHGLYWHSFEKNPENKTKHLEKYKQAMDNGIQLIQIFEDEWFLKREQCKGYIKAILGKQDRVIRAHKCILKKHNIREIKQFQNDNHIQGSAGAIAYALYFQDEVVASMAFIKSAEKRKGLTEPGTYELTRYCVKAGVKIHGGYDKLFGAFRAEYNPQKVISFSDRRFSVGNLYKSKGFVHSGDIAPDYQYYKMDAPPLREHKFRYRIAKIAKKFNFDMTGHTETTAMRELGYLRIYDAGKDRWTWLALGSSVDIEKVDIVQTS